MYNLRIARFLHSTGSERKGSVPAILPQPGPRPPTVPCLGGEGRGESPWPTSRTNPVTLSEAVRQSDSHLLYRPIVVQRKVIYSQNCQFSLLRFF